MSQTFNQTCVTHLFDDNVKRTPMKTALVVGERQLTYAELQSNSNRLGQHLLSFGVKPGSRVAVLAERTAEALIAILAILKIGSIYVPLAPSYPKDRLEFILDDAQVSAILTQRQVIESRGEAWPTRDSLVIDLDELDSGSEYPNQDVAYEVYPGDIAFITYTSGSTGKPKGVMSTHANLTAYVSALRSALCVQRDDRFLHTAPIAFSSSNRQFFLPLCAGSTVVMASEAQIRNVEILFRLIKFQQVTVIDFVPSFWSHCIDELAKLDPTAREVLLQNNLSLGLSASEPLRPDIPRNWRRLLNRPMRLINMFGLTETTGIVTTYEIPEEFDGPNSHLASVPIGRPIEGVSCYLLDDQLSLVSDGDDGELYLAGDTLAIGYFNKPELTDRGFLNNPFTQDGGRLYKTGDWARRDKDGILEFRGRSDQQIKINGMRVEPAEIEQTLRTHKCIRESAVVIAENEGAKQLVCYFVTVDQEKPSPADLTRFLRDHLPIHMIPAHFIELEAIPKTPNAKVDLQTLISRWPEYKLSPRHTIPFRPPSREGLATIFAEVLGLPLVADNVGFYELGGNSLLVLRIVGRVLDEFGLSLSPTAFLDAPTVAQLTTRLETLARELEERS